MAGGSKPPPYNANLQQTNKSQFVFFQHKPGDALHPPANQESPDSKYQAHAQPQIPGPSPQTANTGSPIALKLLQIPFS